MDITTNIQSGTRSSPSPWTSDDETSSGKITHTSSPSPHNHHTPSHLHPLVKHTVRRDEYPPRPPTSLTASGTSPTIESSSFSQMATLTTIPLEILLLILRKLDTIDVVRLGMTCRDLRESMQTRHVWLDQTQNHRRRTAALKLSVPSPTTLTTEALKRFSVTQAKLRIRWSGAPYRSGGENPKFAACGATVVLGQPDLVFLPGGELVIFIDSGDNSISLRRIGLSGGHLSLVRLVDLSGGERDRGGVGWKGMLSAMFPHPVFSYARANSVYLFGISLDGKVNLETEFPIPERSDLLWVNGQGRTAGFVSQEGFESPLVTIIHLDNPGAILEIQLPPDCKDSPESRSIHAPSLRGILPTTDPFLHTPESWKVCFPTPDLAVVFGRDRVLAYALPPFSSLSQGRHCLNKRPNWSWSSLLGSGTGMYRHKTSAEVFYDPSLPDHRFNIHLLYQTERYDPWTYMELITLKIDPSDPSPASPESPTSKRVVTRFPITGLPVMSTIHPGVYRSGTRLRDDGLDIWVTPLEDPPSSQAGRERFGQGSLWVFVSNDDLEQDLEWENVDLDEASGRVFVWGPGYRWKTPPETRIFVGELVS